MTEWFLLCDIETTAEKLDIPSQVTVAGHRYQVNVFLRLHSSNKRQRCHHLAHPSSRSPSTHNYTHHCDHTSHTYLWHHHTLTPLTHLNTSLINVTQTYHSKMFDGNGAASIYGTGSLWSRR